MNLSKRQSLYHYRHQLDAAIAVLAALRIAIFLGYLPAHKSYVAGFKQKILSDRSDDIYQLWAFGETYWEDAMFALLILCCFLRLTSIAGMKGHRAAPD